MNTKEFQRTMAAAAVGPTNEPDPLHIVDDLLAKTREVVAKAAELGLAGSEIANLRRRLATEAEARWMRSRYAMVDLSFATQTQAFTVGRRLDDPREVEIQGRGERTKHSTQVSVPVFVLRWDSLHDWQEHYRDGSRSYRSEHAEFNVGALPPTRVNGAYFERANLTMTVRIPDGIPPALFVRIRRCLAHLRLFDVAMFDRGMDNVLPDVDRAEVGLLWAPADEAWVVRARAPRPAGDPAILVRRGREDSPVYLVAYFDTPDEKPIDNLIREFTQGPADVTLKRRRKVQ